MTETIHPYQPGAILHDAILGAFKAHGLSFDAWLAENGVGRPTARAATYGLGKGPKGRALLERLIEAAGPDVVRAGYLARLYKHLEEVSRTPSRPAEAHGVRRRERRAS